MNKTEIASASPMDMQAIREQTRAIVTELFCAARLTPGDILVVGCSSSEIAARTIGTFSSEETGSAVYETIYALTQEKGLYLAAQCCEHLNRALIIERACAKAYGLPVVNVRPQLKAGGSFAAAAWQLLPHPAAVESIQAQAGIDIGDTLIGMHLAPVAVPVRTRLSAIGGAHVVCARTRPKYIGGARAAYEEEIL